MEKHFCNYNQSLALKELGFDEDCLGRWLAITEWEKPTGEIKLQLGVKVEDYDKNQCLAPLKSQVFEWFREKHGIWVLFGYDEDESEELYWYVDKILKYGIGRLFFHDLTEYDTYEEAESACIDKLIELIKQKL
jgi:hypothetical protein